MPYITGEEREKAIHSLLQDRVDSPGHAAFLIAHVIECLLPEEASFADRATAIGVLEASTHEAKRQLLDSYEDSKRAQNGAVYSSHERLPRRRPAPDRTFDDVDIGGC